MYEIGKLLGFKKQNMTYIIDKLVENGLIWREHDINDRRVVNITITDKGIEYQDKWQKHMINKINIILACFDDEDLKKLAALLKMFNSHISKIRNEY